MKKRRDFKRQGSWGLAVSITLCKWWWASSAAMWVRWCVSLSLQKSARAIQVFHHHRGELSLELFILCFGYLISVPNSFLSFNFQNLDLIKFARSFHAVLTSQPCLCFAQALVLLFDFNFRRLQLNLQQTAHIFSDT